MKIDVLFFASLRETLGCERETVDAPDSVQTVGDLRVWLAERGGAWSTALAPERAVRAALDHTMVKAAERLRQDAEVAFFPPVTGG